MSKGSSVSRGNSSQHPAVSSVSIAGNKKGSWGSKAGTEVAVHKFYLTGSRRRVEVAALFVVPYIELIIVDEDVVDDNEVTDGIEEEGDGGGHK